MAYGNRLTLKRIISSPISLIVAILLFIFLAKAVWNIHEKAALGNRRLDEARAQLTELQARQADLSRKVEYLSTDAGVEAEIRTKYRAVKEGESVAVIIDPSANSAAAADASSTASVGGFWRSILHLFGL